MIKEITLKQILKAKNIMDAQPVPKWDRILWDGKKFIYGKKKGE